ncbi:MULTISPECIES: dTDP-4-dehydrorhamnose 3,5-epimerase family protein [unclassified Pseudofrankia]|uniref:dTDP-4-dehydrorhamnose 3,5-epimerase family protein n=1 Tax=unclassified Pseudofrankia TaxID=2994372 RepID=UPI0008DA3B21|nr:MULTISPECIES: dTDP-4-dehydrorhamnose 3,5-epimerase [unclassified Pseudofrankia]MDT3442581.1 dTDP-4-dehydrorhamnose 3,5-epimerase [Pseudofrankia sp. BMG5.37]OHV71764.1 dTDP-4-dehydrorhamnose 3,5-epimerase [Pseudofrankia sp. BMG5.36]
MEQLDVEGVWRFLPEVLKDDRGEFTEWFRPDPFGFHVGHRLALGQANLSVSRAGVVRGIHFADVPPGQAKWVCCVRGAALDVAVDVRLGSPTFGRWTATRIDPHRRQVLYLPEGVGHAFMALDDDTTVVYLCSQPYVAARERAVSPVDPEIGIEWPKNHPIVLSQKDTHAPSLKEAEERGILPSYEACRRYAKELT